VPSITDVSREKKGGNVFLNQFSTKNAWAAGSVWYYMVSSQNKVSEGTPKIK